MTPDGQIAVDVPADSAADGTTISIQEAVTPTGPSTAESFVTLASFDISAATGQLDTATVTVKYSDDQLAQMNSSSELLVMLVSDHQGGWTALPTRVDAAAHTATADFPHFSTGVLGGFRKFGGWLVDHVITYPLGPVKKPDCTKNGAWRGPDAGWTVANTNWDGGRILINPLDACVEGGVGYGQPQHVVATNRYWYSWDLKLPAGATVSLDDAMEASSVGDFLLTGLYYKMFHATLIPGHSFAQFTVQGNPAGQTLNQSAIADPVSYIVNTVITGLTIISLGELQAQRAALKAAEDELWKGVKIGVETAASIAAKTARGSEWRTTEEARIAAEHRSDSNVVKALNAYLDTYAVASCIVDALQDRVPANDLTTGSPSSFSDIAELLQKGVEACAVEIVAAIMGAGVKWAAGPSPEEIVKLVVRSLGDTKPLQSGVEGAAAAVAKAYGGSDYFRSKLVLTQAADPRLGSQEHCPSLQVGQCGDLPDACEQANPAPVADADETYSLHLDLDANYNRPYDRSDPVSVCGKHSIVITYADAASINPKGQLIDVRTYDSTSKQWKLVQTLDPHDDVGAKGQPYLPLDATGSGCQGDCIQSESVTDGDVDFIVQGANSTLSNGLSVVSVKNGEWRLVPFFEKLDPVGATATGSTRYVPAATLEGDEIHVDINDCDPSCAGGGHTTVAFTYDSDLGGFAGSPVGGDSGRLATAALTVADQDLSAQLYFGRLAALQSTLAEQVTFNIDASFAQSHQDSCVSTVVFRGASGTEGAVYAKFLGDGWGAAENAPDLRVATDDGVMHQQVVLPPNATPGAAWQPSADLVIDGVTTHSGTADLALVSSDGPLSTWRLNGTTVTCSGQ